MSVQKTLFNLNFNPMRGEDILFEFKNIYESGLYKKESSLFHLIIGIGVFIFGLFNQISGNIIPSTGITTIDSILNFIFTIPFIFIFIGILEIIIGSAKKFKKFFTLLYRHISHLYSKTSVEFLVTNFRLIYIYIGEAGLGSSVTDIFYDQIDSASLVYPRLLKTKRLLYLLLGILLIIFSILLYLLHIALLFTALVEMILFLIIGFVVLIRGLLLHDKYSPYLLEIVMNDRRFTFQFLFPANTPNLDHILKQCREFRLGGNRP